MRKGFAVFNCAKKKREKISVSKANNNTSEANNNTSEASNISEQSEQ